MISGIGVLKRTAGGLAACALLCAGPVTADSDDTQRSHSLLSIHPQQSFIPTPLLRHDSNGGLAFDVGGSDQPKLQLQLSEPLSLHTFTGHASGERGLVLAGSSLNFAVGNRLDLAAVGATAHNSSGFTALGSIHCENGTLEADSYRASNCHFINGAAPSSSQLVSLGARYRLDDNVRAGFGLFQQDVDVSGTPYWAAPPVTAPFKDAPFASSIGSPRVLAAPGLESSLTGIDLEFEVGFSTDHTGDMILGLQLTRVLDGQFNNAALPALGIGNWQVAEPFDSARLSLDWNQGPFSGGVQSYYQAPVDFLNRNSLDSYATFDVYFSWRAPWNASVSVGASNLMSGKQDKSVDGQLADPFESIYGRIPYVRYKQDL